MAEVDDPLSLVTSREDMFNLFDRAYTVRERRPSLKVVIALPHIPVESLRSVVQSDDRLAKTYRLEGRQIDDTLFRFSLEKKQFGDRWIKGSVLIEVHSQGWVAITTAKHEFVIRGLFGLLRDLYPDVNTIFLSYPQVAKLHERIQNSYGGQRVVASFSIRRPEDSGDMIVKETIVGEEGTDVGEILKARIEQYRRVWLRNIRFRVISATQMTLLDCLMNNRGLLRLIYGSFTDFHRKVVETTLDFCSDWGSQYDRVRRSVIGEESTWFSCTIKYQQSLIEQSLRDLRAALPLDYLTSVIHGGNPLLAVDLCDYLDGSSFALTAIDDTVEVSPMAKTTTTALWRLLERVQRVLGEGEVVVSGSP